ncbi:MAG: DMT family transporter [Clostridiales bacterium]|jgi:drug/metabolite transporter (DMT)-like permease|nr:DMT family transporter [Clostridiales bacterium]
MLYVLLGITLACGTARTAFSKKVGAASKAPRDLFFYNAVICAVICAATFAAYLLRPTGISPFTALLALAYAGVTLAAQLFNIKALKDGAIGVCTLFYSCGFVIAAFAGILFWGEPFFWSQMVGVLLILGSFFLIVFLSKTAKTPPGETSAAPDAPDAPKRRLWILFAFLSLLSSGFLGVLQKIHQTSGYKEELFPFLFISFAAALAAAVALRFIAPRGEDAADDTGAADGKRTPFYRSGTMFALLYGAVFAAVNILNTYLSGQLPSMIFFPVYNGGVIFTGLFVGLLIFRESVTKYDIIGLLVGVAGILFIALKPF